MAVIVTTGSLNAPAVGLNPLGSVGATSSGAMLANTDVWVTATLTADHTSTITLLAGGRVRYVLTQDATGGRTFKVSDGTTSLTLPVETAPNAVTTVTVFSPNGTDLVCEK